MKLQYDLDARTVTDESGYVMPIVNLFMNGVEYVEDEIPGIIGPVLCTIVCGPARDGQWLCLEKELVGVKMSVN